MIERIMVSSMDDKTKPHMTLPRKGMSRKEITVAEASLMLRKSYHQVLRLIQRGELVGGRTGVHWWVDASDVARFLKAS